MFKRYKDNKGQTHAPRLIKEQALSKVEIPPSEKTVIKTSPARARGEEIGTMVYYDDGTMDCIVNEGISEQAKADLYAFKEFMANGDVPQDYDLYLPGEEKPE